MTRSKKTVSPVRIDWSRKPSTDLGAVLCHVRKRRPRLERHTYDDGAGMVCTWFDATWTGGQASFDADGNGTSFHAPHAYHLLPYFPG